MKNGNEEETRSLEQIGVELNDLEIRKEQLKNELDAASIQEDRGSPKIMDLVLRIIHLTTKVNLGDYQSRDLMDKELRNLARSVKNHKDFQFNQDFLEVLLRGADRPAGYLLPAHWNKFYGTNERTSAVNKSLEKIRIPVGLPTIVGAFSGVGKSRTLINLVYDALENQRPVLVLSLEMTEDQILASLVRIHLSLLDALNHRKSAAPSIGELYRSVREHCDGPEMFDKPEFVKYLERVKKNLTVVDATGFTSSNLIECFESYSQKKGFEPSQVFIDYVQIIKPENQSTRNERRVQMIETMEILTQKAKETNSSWIMAAQLNRSSHQNSKGKGNAVADHSSFQESAAIEQNAALTMNLARNSEDAQSLLIRISKNRFGPTAEEISLAVDMSTGAIQGQA